MNVKERHLSSREALFALVVLGCVFSAYPSSASSAPEKPKLLVLMTAGDAESGVSEQQFAAELELVLDEVDVKSVELERDAFPSLPLTEQLGEIRPLVSRYSATAAVWIVSTSAGKTVVQLVFANDGNSMARTVEASTNEEMALAVRELLWGAYLVEDRVPPSPPPEQTAKKQENEPSPWAILPFVEAGGGLVGNNGATMLLGGGLGAEWMSPIDFLVRALLLGKIGPWDRSVGDLVLGWRVALRIEVGYLWHIGVFSMGPIAHVSVLFSSIAMSLGAGDSQTHDWWSFRGGLGFEIRWQLSRRVALMVDLCAGGLSVSKKFVRLSDGSTVLQTPYMDLVGTLGVVFGF